MTLHLVTGGSGFIGARVARRLHERGDRVRVIDRIRDPGLPSAIDFRQGSICDGAMVADAMRGVDIVHHHAALVAQSGAGRRYREVNVEGSRTVALEAVRAGVGAMIHLSSTSIYGMPPPGAITAQTVPHPFEAYGRSKLEAEGIIADICEAARMPLITIRPRVTLGGGRLGIYQILFQWIAEGRRLYIIGDGKNRQQFIHVDDLIDFYMLALAQERPGTYNVGTDRFGTLREDLETLIRHAGSASRIVGLPVGPAIAALATLRALRLSPLVAWQYRTYHRDCHFDVAPLKAIGWKARYSNAAMLAESYDWFLTHRHAITMASAHRSRLPQRAIGLIRRLS
ncbi:epimerase [Sphingobium lactosutens]|uniref:NAD-dependent epimerase/dehydratase family protein n=1 Tax=Sphingobium lactosutens TaxID=522773 RepID=UPI0015C15E28|nr:NAD-dependent epimerase/dehydratase family protein [Sphingobium lactosutens]NWK97038.1 epimerase [Sphingobium lactosutens]